jgi:hypothetical protein
MEEVSVDYQGKHITAALSGGQTPSGQTLPSEQTQMWYVTIAGTALTKFPASPSDTEELVRQRVLRWLQEHPDMLDRDQIVLGGG